MRSSECTRLVYAAFALALASPAAAPAIATCTGTAAQCAVGEFGNPFESRRCSASRPAERCSRTARARRAASRRRARSSRSPTIASCTGTRSRAPRTSRSSLIAEFGYVTTNDQSRVLTLGPDRCAELGEALAGRRRRGEQPRRDRSVRRRVPVDNEGADAALFCSDQKMLLDGRVLAAGGTDYYNDSCVDWNATLPQPLPFTPGAAELEGIKNARIFDPATNTWTQTDSMEFGRWYPATVTLPDGDVFIASGVTRLVKPVYPDAPTFSGRNVFQTETYDTACGTWSNNGRSPSARFRCSRACICSRTDAPTSTRAVRRSTRSGRPTTSCCGTSSLRTTRRRRPGPTTRSRASRSS